VHENPDAFVEQHQNPLNDCGHHGTSFSKQVQNEDNNNVHVDQKL